jgi:hypothetical protein
MQGATSEGAKTLTRPLATLSRRERGKGFFLPLGER